MDALDGENLLITLNSLIAGLALPLALESTLDLTPSLILGIFESILRTRLAIPPEIRKSTKRDARIDCMKIFLGILGDDVLGIAAGIDRIDPVRLADGMPEETTRVAQLFCWLGKKMNYIAEDGSYIDERVASRAEANENTTAANVSPSMTADTTVESRLSIHSNHDESDDQTTVMADESFVLDAESVDEEAAETVEEVQSIHSIDPSPSVSRSFDEPRCIHEVSFNSPRNRRNRTVDPDNSVASYCDCPSSIIGLSSSGAQTFRQDGWISSVSLEDELRSYEATAKSKSPRNKSSHSLSNSRAVPCTPIRSRPITRHTSPSQHTLALLNERAKLQEELARLKSSHS
ncbi:hypothetical protein SCHPADRAFT_683354 [Schizopora paradoxa]|uniref:Uncharacterized protein n=1 Tax=Schizopora paradoxa TaxID=27342 RepID=A0A0H2RP95_9AGAM|nr:hypothetical protein SCHPADRAFT_683354 [Schizopora paradoxa]